MKSLQKDNEYSTLPTKKVDNSCGSMKIELPNKSKYGK